MSHVYFPAQYLSSLKLTLNLITIECKFSDACENLPRKKDWGGGEKEDNATVMLKGISFAYNCASTCNDFEIVHSLRLWSLGPLTHAHFHLLYIYKDTCVYIYVFYILSSRIEARVSEYARESNDCLCTYRYLLIFLHSSFPPRRQVNRKFILWKLRWGKLDN